MATFGLASTRRIDALVSRFIQLGYVQSHPAEQDGRMRLLTPTAKMMALDREWLALAAVSRTADAQEGESEWSWRVRWPPSPAS